MLVAVLVLLYAILRVGHGTTASFSPAQLEHVSTRPARLPYYAARSLLRMFVALGLSVAFTLPYGYAAARSRRAERILIPVLDILQSVPVLGFLTITVTVFIALFPGQRARPRVRVDLRDLHRAGLEHDVLVLRVAEDPAVASSTSSRGRCG